MTTGKKQFQSHFVLKDKLHVPEPKRQQTGGETDWEEKNHQNGLKRC